MTAPNFYSIDRATYFGPPVIELPDDDGGSGRRVVPLSASDIGLWHARSPAHCWMRLLGAWKETETSAMVMGRLRHSLALAESGFDQEWAIADFPTRRSAAAKAYIADAEAVGKTVVLKSEWEREKKIVDTLKRARPEIAKMFATANTEAGIVFEQNGIWWKALHDALDDSLLISVDLKTRTPDPAYGLNLYRWRELEKPPGLLRVGHYLRSMQIASGDTSNDATLLLVVVENTAPHHSVIFTIPASGPLGQQAIQLWDTVSHEIGEWNAANGEPLTAGELDAAPWPPSYCCETY